MSLPPGVKKLDPVRLCDVKTNAPTTKPAAGYIIHSKRLTTEPTVQTINMDDKNFPSLGNSIGPVKAEPKNFRQRILKIMEQEEIDELDKLR